MCGFVALAGVDSPELVEAGVAALRHRGPDGEHVWRSNDGRVSMGHARLAILDLSSAADQPMVSRDGKAVLAYNGEVYNFAELVKRLDSPLRTHGDTEAILELLRRDGASAIESLRGMFAFAYWDGHELLLARDRLGIKPLYYVEKGGRLAAASELGALLAMRQVDPKPDLLAIGDYLSYLYVPPPRTGIQGCFELPPGHLLRWRPGDSVKIERYWRVPSVSLHAHVSPAEVRDVLGDAVRTHLVSDVPVGVFLSGGLDSSSLVALAAPHVQRLKTFTVTFGSEGAFLDERHFAREVAMRYATDHQEIEVSADAAAILPKLVSHFGQPFGNPTAVLSYALSEATRREVKVVLAGDGGDEVFAGYPRYQGFQLAQRMALIPPAIRERAKRWVDHLPQAHARGARLDRIRRFLSGNDASETYLKWLTYFDEDAKSELSTSFASMGRSYLQNTVKDLASPFQPDHAPLLDLMTFLPHNVLRYGDRMSMAHGLEVRVPFCDHLLVERIAPLPLARKMPFGMKKGLFRWAMRGLLPLSVSVHKKVGFNPPISQWLTGSLRDAVFEYLSDASIRQRGILRPQTVQSLLKQFFAGAGELGHPVWMLLVLEAWLRWLSKMPSATKN